MELKIKIYDEVGKKVHVDRCDINNKELAICLSSLVKYGVDFDKIAGLINENRVLEL